MYKFLTGPAPARIFNSLSFYGGWTALVIFAAAGEPGKGLWILAALMAVHFFLSHQRSKDAVFLCTVTLAGCLLDIGYQSFGVLSYASPNPYLSWAPPFWMVGVYFLFAAAVDYSLFWLRNFPLIAAICGAVGGVMSYLAGARLGAAEFLLPDGQSLIIIGVVWAIFMPVACWYSALLDRHMK